MKKKYLFISLILVFALILSGCECKHEWSEATCESPMKCTKCDAVEGEALGHDWLEATCESPKTCARCGISEGDTTEHSFGDWTIEDDEMSRECSLCGEKESQAANPEFIMISLLEGTRSFNMEINTLSGRMQIISALQLSDNHPGPHIVFDAEGNGVYYNIKENPNAASISDADGYMLDPMPMKVVYISYEKDELFDTDQYTFDLIDDEGNVYPASMSKAIDGGHNMTIEFLDGMLRNLLFEFPYEKQLFTGEWSDSNGNMISFNADSSFSCTLNAQQISGKWLVRPEGNNISYSEFKVMLCHEEEGVTYTDCASFSIEHNDEEFIDQYINDIDYSSLVLRLNMNGAQFDLIKNA